VIRVHTLLVFVGEDCEEMGEGEAVKSDFCDIFDHFLILSLLLVSREGKKDGGGVLTSI